VILIYLIQALLPAAWQQLMADFYVLAWQAHACMADDDCCHHGACAGIF